MSLNQNSKVLDEFKTRAYKKAQEFDIKKIVPLYEEIYLKAIKSLKQAELLNHKPELFSKGAQPYQ